MRDLLFRTAGVLLGVLLLLSPLLGASPASALTLDPNARGPHSLQESLLKRELLKVTGTMAKEAAALGNIEVLKADLILRQKRTIYRWTPALRRAHERALKALETQAEAHRRAYQKARARQKVLLDLLLERRALCKKEPLNSLCK